MSSFKHTLQQKNSKICCGKFGKTVGLKGDIRLYLSSGQTDTLDEIEVIYLEDGTPLYIEQIQYRTDFIIVRFESYTTLESVKHLTHSQLFLEKKDLVQLPEGQYYWFELQSLRVLGQQGQDYGSVDHLYSNGVQDILKTTSGAQIPFVQPEIVQSVCLEKSQIIVDYDCHFSEQDES